MKNIQKISALLAASATLSMAGVINVYDEEAKKPTASLNLTTIDSLTFSGKAEKKAMNFSGKTKQKAIKLADMDHIDFKLKDKSKETMTVTVGEGIYEGTHTFKLSDIKNIEIIEVDSDADADGDGLTDLNEIYKYGTNSQDANTDGDSYSDGEELGGMYSATNPTKFNPLIADLPELSVTLKRSPRITLNVTSSEGVTVGETITQGEQVSTTNSISYEQTRSADIMNAWEISTTHGVELGTVEKKYVGNITVGYNSSYTSSTGMTWNTTEEKSVAESYEKSKSKEMSQGREVSGAKICMQVELKNTSDIAYTITGLKLSASTYDIMDGSLKILAELDREGGWSNMTLESGKFVEAYFCNENVPVENVENLIYNTSSIVLGATTKEISFGVDKDDFTKAYTDVAGKTANLIIDFGPGHDSKLLRYNIATKYRYNFDHKKTDDMYDEQISVADLLRTAQVKFKQDSMKVSSKEKFYGLSSIDDFKTNLDKRTMWFVSIQKAADIKKGGDNAVMYSYSSVSYDLEKLFVSAGDVVQIIYNKDEDLDGLPLSKEHLLGTSDNNIDSDNDTIPDYEEVTGWTRCRYPIKSDKYPVESKCSTPSDTIRTNPANADTDGDRLRDLHDPEPTRREMFTDATLETIQVFFDATMTKNLMTKDFEASDKARNFELSVEGPGAYVKIVPKANKVAQVKVTMGKDVLFVQPAVDTLEDENKNVYYKNVYYFTTGEPFSVIQKNSVKIEVKSEDEAKDETYTLSISSTLIPPTELLLGKTKDRENIVVNYTLSPDERVSGYIILRGNKGDNLPDNIKNGAKEVLSNGTYNGFTAFNIEGAKMESHTDNVKSGSPYYAYRVYAYARDAADTNKVVFSKGTEQKARSVGRIKVEYSMDDFGAEYQTISGKRADITAKVSLHEGSSEAAKKLSSWEGYDLEAGCLTSSETVIFFSKRDCKADKEDRTPDYSTRTDTIGRSGLFLYFDVDADKNGEHVYAKRGISWPYDKMAEVLQDENENTSIATGKGGAAPKQGKQMKFLVGQSGIEYDNDNNKCSDDTQGCGKLPHTGYKFTFKYSWVDDNENY